MKKIIALALLVAALLSLCACGKTYPPVDSTEEEATTVMTLTYGDKKYEVKYELYRALFLNYKSEIDGGDSTVWSGENKTEYIEKIHALITSLVTDIYAAFALCEDIGFDLYSSEVEAEIDDYIRLSVEGGSYNGKTFIGYGGDYEAYLAALKKVNLNYNSQILIYRYAIAIDAINEHFIGTYSADEIDGSITVGAIKYTKDDIKEYYYSDKCVRVLRTFIPEYLDNDPLARAERLRQDLKEAAKKGESAVSTMMMDRGSVGATDGVDGVVIARNNLDSAFYQAMVDEAFSIKEGEVGAVIPIHDGTEKRYYIIYRGQKSDSHFEKCYSDIAYIYLRDSVGTELREKKETLTESIAISEFLRELDYSSVTME